MPEDRYPKKLFSLDGNIESHRGRQRKVWSRIIDLFVSEWIFWMVADVLIKYSAVN